MEGYNIRSSGFKVLDIVDTVYLFDIPDSDKKKGKISLFSLPGAGNAGPANVVRRNIGVIDYVKGRITLNPINIVSGKSKDNVEILEISAIPESNDVIGLQDLYLQLDKSDCYMIVDEIASGADPSGSTYTVTPSYNTGKIVR